MDFLHILSKIHRPVKKSHFAAVEVLEIQMAPVTAHTIKKKHLAALVYIVSQNPPPQQHNKQSQNNFYLDMITLEKVAKSYTEKKVLHEISLSAHKGEIIGFLGPNGAGKTTTMKLIMGLIKAEKGSISINGFDPIRDRLQMISSLGYLPENNPLYGDMKVDEYLDFICSIKKSNSEDLKTLKKDVNIQDVENTKIEELSRGYRQRVGLAAALLGNPKILILDEPTSGLDPIEQDKIKELIKKTAQNKTVIFSTHILSEVEDIATRLVIINKGHIVYDGVKPKGKGAVEKLFKQKVKASD